MQESSATPTPDLPELRRLDYTEGVPEDCTVIGYEGPWRVIAPTASLTRWAPTGPVPLNFHFAQLTQDCRVTVDGRTVTCIRKFKLEASYDGVTSVELEGILDRTEEVNVSGTFYPNPPEAAR